LREVKPKKVRGNSRLTKKGAIQNAERGLSKNKAKTETSSPKKPQIYAEKERQNKKVRGERGKEKKLAGTFERPCRKKRTPAKWTET